MTLISAILKFGGIITVITIAGAVSIEAHAQGSGLCPGLTGQARRDCLLAERERGRQELEVIDRRNKRLDRAQKLACIADDALAAAAAKAAGFVGTIVYRGTRAAGDAISNGASNCPR